MAEYAACEIVMGVIGGVAVVLSVVLIVAYRSYKYEQELDSLLWKIDPIELKVKSIMMFQIVILVFLTFSFDVLDNFLRFFFRLVNSTRSQALLLTRNIQVYKDIVSVKARYKYS